MLSSWRREVEEKLSDYRGTVKKLRAEREALKVTEKRLRSLEEATRLVQSVAERIQNRAHTRIARIVTRCLSVFEDGYTFRILFSRARGKTEARMLFERDGMEVDPVGASGLGVVQVAAFALRLAVLCMTSQSRIVVMDEPFYWVKSTHIPALRSLIRNLSQELGIQFIVVTHIDELRLGKVVLIET